MVGATGLGKRPWSGFRFVGFGWRWRRGGDCDGSALADWIAAGEQVAHGPIAAMEDRFAKLSLARAAHDVLARPELSKLHPQGLDVGLVLLQLGECRRKGFGHSLR